MQQYFTSLSHALFKIINSDEVLLLSFEGEDSDFIRLNNNKVRQAGSVSQRVMSLDLIKAKLHAEACIDLSGDLDQDLKQLSVILIKLREQRKFLPEDPYLLYATEINSSIAQHENEKTNSAEALAQIHYAAEGLDLVGIFANGIQYTGFANSLGQLNWHSNANFNFDWSCYHAQDKAVKSAYAGFNWKTESLHKKMQAVRQQLSYISKAPININPGQYRAYITPTALNEIIGMMAWGGFSLKSHQTKETPLIQMIEQQRILSPEITIREQHARGLAPEFTSSGFIKPNKVELIKQGKFENCLVSPRSAVEYDVISNAESEYPNALELNAGNLPNEDILKKLGTGLYINNLWYLNFSDRNACKLTGMTRFACFWVENGVIQAPINVMRFDESIYDLLGNNLQALTTEREFIFDSSTYGKRSNSSIELPGALVKSMNFTL